MRENVWSLLGMLLSVVLILLLAWYVSRWLGRRGAGAFGLPAGMGAGERFCVLGQISLGQSQRLLLIRLADRCCLLGVTQGSITLLRELEGDEAKEWLNAQRQPETKRFVDILETLRKRK